ncbi:hypothetical protein FPJ27_26750 [Burkholderia sp. MS455]|uniref:hypothetical protein n=1 Tax=Burkholderia sp. MS455 TaxID=2811788 RepID=UPI001957F1B9|nr:hypothetical protein [Burkholderia sp. MS455]QRR09825.1 hypothetical protein FPJ27_26750 [Burkholderia sp. MS455]
MMKTSRDRLVGREGRAFNVLEAYRVYVWKKRADCPWETPLSEFDRFRFLDVRAATFPIKWLQPEDANPGQRTVGSSYFPIEASLKRFLSKG